MRGQYNQPGHGRHFQGLITWPARYLTRHIRVRFLAGIQPRRYYYYYYYYYYSLVPIQKQFAPNLFQKEIIKLLPHKRVCS